MEGEPIVLGAYIAASKKAKMDWNLVVNRLKDKHGVVVKDLDLDRPLGEQGPFHFLFHKITDELVRENTGEKHRTRIRNLEDYVKQHPEVIDLEPTLNQRGIMDRSKISALLKDVDGSLPAELQVACPAYTVLEREEEDYSETLRKANLKFPLVAKTIQACGNEDSHKIGIIFTEKGLHQLSTPIMVQEYYNHNAIIFKVFMVDDYLHVVRRASLKNLDPSATENIVFNSQKPVPEELFDKDRDVQDKAAWPDPEPPVLHAVTAALQQHLGLHLLGVDMIRQVETGKLGIVDVNYFPSYIGVPEFNERLADFVAASIRRKLAEQSK
ncbi:inositol-1,3,4-trisphosphate 5/6-kinase [Balamuthia mandrillaris]